ncbi:hypothetical protein E2C01_015253 [Portunus trituberculatus]|uniref:Uncharacterized protein n=1 Tax=Portunus trituberculatus TaxID=210409 RepID=A0A5B7DMG2_PORTR|nr:hypothetical protein [Portunus trituberculatus]
MKGVLLLLPPSFTRESEFRFSLSGRPTVWTHCHQRPVLKIIFNLDGAKEQEARVNRTREEQREGEEVTENGQMPHRPSHLPHLPPSSARVPRLTDSNVFLRESSEE